MAYAKERLCWYALNSMPPDNLDFNSPRSVAEMDAGDRWDALPKSLQLVFGDEGGGTNQFSFSENCEAFNYFLTTLGTNDCQSAVSPSAPRAAGWDGSVERLAYRGLCFLLEDINYTNAYPHLKALALNPRGIMRDRAISLALALGPVDGSMTDFVEAVVTNSACFTYFERGTACSGYVKRLLSIQSADGGQSTEKTRAIRMFYRHRNDDSAGAPALDVLFVRCLDGYLSSSNRLSTALNIMNDQACHEAVARYFTTITNQLLTSGQPLRQLNIGEADE